jgi:hypothetical protein
MSTPTPSPQRIVELWPTLRAEDQTRLVEVAERMAVAPVTRRLSPREKMAIGRSRADFAAGRFLDEAEYEAEMAAFMAKLEAGASTAS